MQKGVDFVFFYSCLLEFVCFKRYKRLFECNVSSIQSVNLAKSRQDEADFWHIFCILSSVHMHIFSSGRSCSRISNHTSNSNCIAESNDRVINSSWSGIPHFGCRASRTLCHISPHIYPLRCIVKCCSSRILYCKFFREFAGRPIFFRKYCCACFICVQSWIRSLSSSFRTNSKKIQLIKTFPKLFQQNLLLV